jgi:hypothetical protein
VWPSYTPGNWVGLKLKMKRNTLFSIPNRKYGLVLGFDTATGSCGAPNARQDGVCCGCAQTKRTRNAVRVTQGHIRRTTPITRPAGSVRDVGPACSRRTLAIRPLTPSVTTVFAAGSIPTWTSYSSAVRMRRKADLFTVKWGGDKGNQKLLRHRKQ